MGRYASPFIVAMIVCLHGLVAGPALGQDRSFVGIVVESNVEVRAGIGKQFYIVNHLPKDTLVKVDDVMSGWYAVVPPEGTYSIISKAHVDAKGDGSTGVVNSDRALVRAAGLDVPQGDVVDEWFRTQGQLMKGDVVQIVGEVKSFYKVLPPANAVVYLPPGSVRRATAEEIRRGGGARPEPVADPEPPVTDPEPPVTDPEPPVTDPEPPVTDPEPPVRDDPEPPVTDREPPVTYPQPPARDREPPARDREPPVMDAGEVPTDTTDAPARDATAGEGESAMPAAESAVVRAAEARMREAEKLKLEEQPLEELLATYKKLQLDPQLSALDRYIVDARVGQLERNVAIAAILKRGTKLKLEMESRPSVDVDEIEREAMRRAGYVAMGRLTASTVYDGENLPRLYRLVDAQDRRTVAYVRPSPAIDARLMGKLVGIYGDIRYDPALKLRLIDAKELEVLGVQAEE